MNRFALIITLLWPFWTLFVAYFFTRLVVRKTECQRTTPFLVFTFFTLWPIALLGLLSNVMSGHNSVLMDYSVNLVAPFFKHLGIDLLFSSGHLLTVLEEIMLVSVSGLGHLLSANLLGFVFIKILMFYDNSSKAKTDCKH